MARFLSMDAGHGAADWAFLCPCSSGVTPACGRRSTSKGLGAWARISNRIGPSRYSSLACRASFRTGDARRKSTGCSARCTTSGDGSDGNLCDSEWLDAKWHNESGGAREAEWGASPAAADHAPLGPRAA